MKFFLLLFVFIVSSLNAQILFQAANPCEKDAIQSNVIAFYAQQLIQAGVFEDEKEAREAAQAEIKQDQLDKDKDFFYYYLVSEEDRMTHYGYLIYWIKDHNAYLDAIYLKEEYRGRGIGKQTFRYLENLLLEKDVQEIKLYVFDYNKSAIEFYNKNGYEIETTYYIEDKPFGYHMKKTI